MKKLLAVNLVFNVLLIGLMVFCTNHVITSEWWMLKNYREFIEHNKNMVKLIDCFTEIIELNTNV